MKSFQLSAQETSPSSMVTDTIRKLDLESARYSKLISTLPQGVDTIGIRLTDSDLDRYPKQSRHSQCIILGETVIKHIVSQQDVGNNNKDFLWNT